MEKTDHARIISLEKRVTLLESEESQPPEIIDDPVPEPPEPLPPVQRLRDLVEPIDKKDIRRRVVSVNGKPWLRVFAGQSCCQYMYPKLLEILDVTMTYVSSVYPRNDNNAFVLGDAGCWPGGSCPNHVRSHDNRHTIDLNYCTLSGFNMTHYRTRHMPVKYMGSKVEL